MRTALDIKKISTLFTETHCITHSSTRLTGDRLVNFVLDNKIERESNLTRKHSVTVHAEQVFRSAFNYNSVQGEIPTDAAYFTLPGQEPSEPPTS